MTILTGPRFGPAAPGAPRQLVVICHGVGADGHDLIGVGPILAEALPNAVFTAPDGPARYDMMPPGNPQAGRQWFSLRDWHPEAMEAGARAACGSLDRYLDETLEELGLPATEYALVGFSQGAMMALFAGLRRPVPPRAILAYSGMLLGPAVLGAEMANRARVLLVHGAEDEVVPADASSIAYEALKALDVPVELMLRPDLGHSIDVEGLTEGACVLREAFSVR